MARDVTIFPEPLSLTPDEQLSFIYKATSTSFGVDSIGEVAGHVSSSFNALTNLVLKILLTSKGSVAGKKQEGTKLNSLLRNGYNQDTFNEDIALILLDTETQIKQIQSISTDVSPKSKLDSITLSDLSLTSDKAGLTITLIITNQLDQSLAVQIN